MALFDNSQRAYPGYRASVNTRVFSVALGSPSSSSSSSPPPQLPHSPSITQSNTKPQKTKSCTPSLSPPKATAAVPEQEITNHNKLDEDQPPVCSDLFLGGLNSPPLRPHGNHVPSRPPPTTFLPLQIKSILEDLTYHPESHVRHEFYVDSPLAFEELLDMVDGDFRLQNWSVEYLDGKIITLPRPAHELLPNFWQRVSRGMVETGWLTSDECDDLHVHQANIELIDGNSMRPDLCIVPNRAEHFPTIVFESVLTQSYTDALQKVGKWFSGSGGKIAFVVLINFLYPKDVVTRKDCTIELWKHDGIDDAYNPQLAYGPKIVYPEPEEGLSDETEQLTALKFTYEEFFGLEGIPEHYLHIKDKLFCWSLKSLRSAVDLALRSHLKEQNFLQARKRKRSEASDETTVTAFRPRRHVRSDSSYIAARTSDVQDPRSGNSPAGDNNGAAPPTLPKIQ